MGLLQWAGLALIFALAYTYVPKWFQPKLRPHVEGHFHPKFRRVAELLRENIVSGVEQGCAFTVYHKGEPLIDMWAGYADPAAKRPWTEDTMSTVYSTTKGLAAVAIARMVEKGWLDYKKPVAYYWPEFAQSGKGEITVEQLISHQAGLIGLDEAVFLDQKRDNHQDHKRYIDILEKTKPFWKPGSKHGYHALTFGCYVDALVQKADPKHRNMSQFFQEEIAEPFDVDFYIGVPKKLFYRMARIQFKPALERLYSSFFHDRAFKIFWSVMFKPDSWAARAASVFDFEDPQMNSPYHLEIGASSYLGMGSARGIAQLYSYVANGGSLKGKQLLSPQLVQQLFSPITTGTDQVFDVATSFGLGVMFLPNQHEQFQGQTRIGHCGHGGNNGLADPKNNLAIGYVTNFPSIYGFGDDPRYLSLEKVFYDCFYDYINEKK